MKKKKKKKNTSNLSKLFVCILLFVCIGDIDLLSAGVDIYDLFLI